MKSEKFSTDVGKSENVTQISQISQIINEYTKDEKPIYEHESHELHEWRTTIYVDIFRCRRFSLIIFGGFKYNHYLCTAIIPLYGKHWIYYN